MAASEVLERWLPMAGYEGIYDVSDEGRVRSCDRHVSYVRRGGVRYDWVRSGRILSGCIVPSGGQTIYRAYGLSRDGKLKIWLGHRLVLLTFVGPPPSGYEACHEDGDGLNNRLSNLRWDTHKANFQDAVQHGSYKPLAKYTGEYNPICKLSDAQIRAIRERPGETHANLAREYGVTLSHMARIRKKLVRNTGSAIIPR